MKWTILTFSLVVFIAQSPQMSVAQWKRHTIDSSSRGADGVRVADLNGDRLPDFVTGWEEGGRIRVCLNPWPDKVREAWPSFTVGKVKSPEDAVFVDLNGDARLDVVSCCEGKTRSVYVHWQGKDFSSWKTEAFPTLADQAQWMFATPLDVDQRNGIDLVIGAKGKGAQVGWLQSPENPENLADWKWHPLTEAGWIMSIIAVDMDRDGDKDILFSDRKGEKRGVHWLVNPGKDHETASWRKRTIGGTDREVMFLALGDINQDGRQDIAAAVKNGPITWFCRNDEEGLKWTAFEVPLPENAGSGKGVTIIDVDLDGQNDLVYTCEHSEKKEGVGWLKPTSSVFGKDWTPVSISGIEKGIKFDLIQSLDLDQDGDLDMITCEERDNLGVIWYENPTK